MVKYVLVFAAGAVCPFALLFIAYWIYYARGEWGP